MRFIDKEKNLKISRERLSTEKRTYKSTSRSINDLAKARDFSALASVFQ